MSREVQAMFAGIAPRYDRANRILSLGIDVRWRRRAVRLAGSDARSHVLDVACGTGDLSLEFRGRGAAQVIGLDFTRPMLLQARAKARGREGLAFEIGRAHV
jgi:demethylmenaquinone methyltransferase/2-methoxy-6-polyprenyl-1,4-benzoquinol methylase